MKRFIKLFLLSLIVVIAGFVGTGVYSVNADEISYTPEPNATATIPTSFDLRSKIDIGVENQNPFGICYAFASLTSIETYLALTYGEYYDFSEMHFAMSLYLQDNYHSSVDDALNDGGNFGHFILYTQKDKSLVLEDEMPISDYVSLSSSTRNSRLASKFNSINNNFYPLVKVNDTKTFDKYVGNKSQYSSTELTNFRNGVKQHIMQYGSLTAGIYTSSLFSYSTKYLRVVDDSLISTPQLINKNTNHLISIVGWDDNYNANGAWQNSGAYLCLNSWGKNFGNDGYFYVSYEDYFIESTIQGVVNASLATTNSKISTISAYQNQTSMFAHVFDEPYPTIYTANIVDTSNYVGQNINYIDSFIQGDTTYFYIKFFNDYNSALSGINSVTNGYLKSSIKQGHYSMYSKHKLNSSLNVSNNYMVVIRKITGTVRTYSLAGDTADNLNITPCYYNGSGLGTFDIEDDLWAPGVTGRNLDYTLPLIFHTDKPYIQVSPFESSTDILINNTYVKNNSIVKNKSFDINLTNVTLTNSDLTNIKIKKLYKNTFADATLHFQISLKSSNCITITMKNPTMVGFNPGNYLVYMNIANNKIYRAFEVNSSTSYNIEYHLDGGKADNPSTYTTDQTKLILNQPTKDGYIFVGWYTDSNFTTSFNPDNLPYTDINLYAKYDFATPTITSKSQDISVTYHENLNVTLSIAAWHYLQNSYNTFSYQWYMKKELSSPFSVVSGATNPSFTVNSVAQSGYYACQVTITFTDTNLVTTPQQKILSASIDNAIIVNIKPYIYDMSNVKWNYTEPFFYNSQSHNVELINLPAGVTVNYENNQKTDIGSYTAVATLVYDNMDGNAIASPVDNLNWQIRKAKIIISVDDIISTEPINSSTLNSMYSCNIESEYFPENIVLMQDKINYLNLIYTLTPTSNANIKIISATTSSFDIYEITVINGKYRVVIYNLTSNNITAYNDKGFVVDCMFNATSHTPSEQTKKLLKQSNLTMISGYDMQFSYLNSESASVTIPMERIKLLNNLQVYMLKDGKLTKLKTTSSSAGITFVTNDQQATYIVVKQDNAKTTNSQMFILITLVCIYVALFMLAIISTIKFKKY